MEGRVALVTGASGGIGHAISRRLGTAGATVAVHYGRNEAAGRDLAERLPRAAAFGADMLLKAGPDKLIDEVESELGPVDVLVANHGVARRGGVEDVDADDFDYTLAVNLRAPFLLARRVLPGMRERGFGRILNVASTSVREPIANLMLSNAHRASMITAFKTIARSVAGDGVTFNTLLPGRIATDRAYSMAGSPEDAEAAAAKEVPAGRMGKPEEMAAAAAFFCSAGAAYVTGETLAVDGGMTRSI
jgi:3-oxoacyl-[acyl-carrier protein] reductase